MVVLKFILKNIMSSLGYDIRRVSRASFAAAKLKSGGDPITYQHIPSLRRSAIFDIKVEDARGSLGFKFRAGLHPFVEATLAAGDSRSEVERFEALQEVLSGYYGTVRPSSALEAVDLAEDDAPGLKGVAATGWPYPWSDQPFADIMPGLRPGALKYGRFVPFSEGITAFGPVGTRKLSLEVARMHNLIASVARNGFDPFYRNQPMKVVALRRGHSYRWLVADGNHRLAVCAAFSIGSAPAMVIEVVRREDCEYWPQVVAGTYSPQGARALFDRLYDGVPARVCEGWIGRTRSANEQRTLARCDRRALVASNCGRVSFVPTDLAQQ